MNLVALHYRTFVSPMVERYLHNHSDLLEMQYIYKIYMYKNYDIYSHVLNVHHEYMMTGSVLPIKMKSSCTLDYMNFIGVFLHQNCLHLVA